MYEGKDNINSKMVMKRWCYLSQVRVNKITTWLHQCVQHIIWVEEVWDIGCQVIVNTIGIKTLDAVGIKESNNNWAGCLINICYFRNTSPSSISNLVLYWVGNYITSGVDSIQSGINLQWISTSDDLQND